MGSDILGHSLVAGVGGSEALWAALALPRVVHPDCVQAVLAVAERLHSGELTRKDARQLIHESLPAVRELLASSNLAIESLCEVYRVLGEATLYKKSDLKKFDNYLCTRIDQLTPKQAADVLWAYGKLAHCKSATVEQIAERILGCLNDPDTRKEIARYATKISYGLFQCWLGEATSESPASVLMRKLLELTLEQEPDISFKLGLKNQVTLAYHGAALGYQELSSKITSAVLDRNAILQLDDPAILQLNSTCRLLHLSGQIPAGVAAKIAAALGASSSRHPYATEAPEEGFLAERLEQLVAALNLPGVAIERQFRVLDMAVDIALLVNGKPALVVEIDGAAHYLNRDPKDGLCGKDRVQDKIMELEGIIVIHLAAMKIRQLMNGESSDRDAYFSELAEPIRLLAEVNSRQQEY